MDDLLLQGANYFAGFERFSIWAKILWVCLFAAVARSAWWLFEKVTDEDEGGTARGLAGLGLVAIVVILGGGAIAMAAVYFSQPS